MKQNKPDYRYFKEKLSLLLRDLQYYTDEELARALTRLAITSNESVVMDEITSTKGEIVVTSSEDGRILAVTRQDDEGRILSVIKMCEGRKPVAWWNKSVGGFYLNEEHIKPYEKASHEIVCLYE